MPREIRPLESRWFAKDILELAAMVGMSHDELRETMRSGKGIQDVLKVIAARIKERKNQGAQFEVGLIERSLQATPRLSERDL
jgi:hypothetical protein